MGRIVGCANHSKGTNFSFARAWVVRAGVGCERAGVRNALKVLALRAVWGLEALAAGARQVIDG